MAGTLPLWDETALMNIFTHKIAYGGELAEFFGVQPRPSRPEESETRSRVYEVVGEGGVKLWFRYAEPDSGDQAELKLRHEDVPIFCCNFESVRMLWDFHAGSPLPHLILLQGSTCVTLDKNPWRVSVSNSTFYQNHYDPNPFAEMDEPCNSLR